MTWDYGCPQGKRRYPTADDAQEAARKATRRGRAQRPYRCPVCHGWHLTHLLHETRPKYRARTIYQGMHHR